MTRRARPARALAAAGALLVAAWFGLGVVQSRATGEAQTIIAGLTLRPSPAADRAGRLLDRAAVLNPDERVDLLEAQRLIGAGRPQAARRVLRGVVARSPDDVAAWALVRLSMAEIDPAFAREADAQLTRLDPLRGRP